MLTTIDRSHSVADFMKYLKICNPNQPEFHQAVHEFAEIILPFIAANPHYQGMALMERVTEPDKVYMFRVTWVDDNNKVRINKGYRVQFNNAIGPYKGGLRFHPSVNLSILKFLGFEQIFKNSLTTLPLGGGKGGSNFDPKGKSDGEVMRFCQAFMMELQRHIGHNIDVPAGDIGVGSREIGYMYGIYKKLRNEHVGVLTGKGMTYGGSLIRTEATGYGNVFFMDEVLKYHGMGIEGKKCVISGSGNVAVFNAEKVVQLGGKVLTMSDSSGFIYDIDGINQEKIDWIKDLKFNRRGRIKEYADEFGAEYRAGETPWKVPCDLAFPCATQNELDQNDAESLIENGCIAVAEGANMPSTIEATKRFLDANVLFAPGKASNAGGVATSGLEMSQNSLRISWSREEVEERLKSIMQNIHENCVEFGKVNGNINYVKGANIAGFVKVADAILDQGVI